MASTYIFDLIRFRKNEILPEFYTIFEEQNQLLIDSCDDYLSNGEMNLEKNYRRSYCLNVDLKH